MIVIVDYGVGNLASILNMLTKAGARAKLSTSADDILEASKLILPGVGAFDHAMRSLDASGLRGALERRVLEDRIPVIGLCLGMQLLTRGSEEGSLPGLGWIDAETRRFRLEDTALKVPHMGWNTIVPRAGKPLVQAFDATSRFYFVHSYYVDCRDDGDVAATTRYGHEFTSIIQRGHIMGTQFHPEKSHRFGMTLLRTFAEL